MGFGEILPLVIFKRGNYFDFCQSSFEDHFLLTYDT